ncbi:MAG: hypothetical protein CMC55_08550 [Flavobacteriaceae bacterium]|nr:hypothetical protein [Flavobacteriaceae bacterium]|tara:strand:+ start:2278 stop:2649 length:372 start_codon:yes stop_codon:yes gene_type:complete
MKVSEIQIGMRICLPPDIISSHQYWHYIYHIDENFLYSLDDMYNPINKELLKDLNIVISHFEHLKTIQVLHADNLYAVNMNTNYALTTIIDTTNHTYVRQKTNKELVELLYKTALAKYKLNLI